MSQKNEFGTIPAFANHHLCEIMSHFFKVPLSVGFFHILPQLCGDLENLFVVFSLLPMVVVWGGGGMAWAARQLDLQLSWVFWVRKRQNACERDRERGRHADNPNWSLPQFPLNTMCIDPDPEDGECDVIKWSLSYNWSLMNILNNDVMLCGSLTNHSSSFLEAFWNVTSVIAFSSGCRLWLLMDVIYLFKAQCMDALITHQRKFISNSIILLL